MDKIITNDRTVACDGGEYEGHPRVYLDLEKTGETTCPYCGCEFMLSDKA